MSLPTLTPAAARQQLEQGALLIDIRAADEHARERIAQARHLPLEQLLAGTAGALPPGQSVIFHCRSGQRTRLQAAALAACAPGAAYVLEGGLDGWKQAGLPVLRDVSQPLELQRQVQIAAGAMIVLGSVLGATLTPWLYLLPGFIGCGLVFAGVSGFCGLARLLMKMPWNRRRAD
ncbi:rhodanese family protein [Massilia sp. NR 4-1]|uniref:rhodanese family protein n=1 Tax=Massilia sp. NR 4-1 TaxID=1678028 RepID=UPI00067B57ED|nr:rhodanese family protein [Massilia sp. NR 4-1]AKU22284.1 hypothetical protein ACZ75_13250 [Massilia sp. NR 4-1]